jgi:16S rRNA (cytosine967-C5)-methyltransferase
MEMRRLSEPLALARTIKQLGLSDRNAVRMAHQLVSETVRRQNLIDRFINDAMRPDGLSKYSLGVQAFLRLYVYHNRVAKNWLKPDFNEADNIVKLARSILGWETLHQVEPILGTLLIRKPTQEHWNSDDYERIMLETFHPFWFVKYCVTLFGRSEALKLLHADMKPPPTYIKINTLSASEHEVLKNLSEDHIALRKVEELKYTYEVVDANRPITSTDSFAKGLLFVQDKASCFAVEAGNPQPGERVLDVCAAPGAKTTYLAQLMENKGEIISIDYSKRRMTTWSNEIRKAGVKIANPIIADGRLDLPVNMKVDLLMLDPPCTGTGTFAKTPSAKWRLVPNSIEKMAEIQWRILNNCAGYVRVGGSLVYSTCSITVEENEMLIERFLKWHHEFSLADISPQMGMPALRGLEKCRRLYPHVDRCNGFFVARMTKSEQLE